MKSFISIIISRLTQIEPKKIYIYIIVYLLIGTGMNALGHYAEIAKFNSWWQVLTCYLLYMIPISIILSEYPFIKQYAYGLFFMGILEFSGYAMETSYVYPNNFIENWFGIRNFSLAMTLFLSLYFPVGNLIVNKIFNKIYDKE
jgi:hypothetical protein